MRAYRAPFIVGIVLAAGLFWLAIAGYSVVIYYAWPIILFLLLVIAAVTIVCQRSVATYLRALLLLVMLSTTAAFAGHWGRRLHCRHKCRSCEPILESIEDYRAEHGHYPEELSQLQGFARAQEDAGLVIGQGKLSDQGGHILNKIDSHDALIYLGTDSLLCVVPVTKQLPMSITRFYVYEWDSETRAWKYGKLIWYLT